MDWLRSYRPDLVARYEELYARGAYAPAAERDRLTGLVRRGRVATRPFGPAQHRGFRRVVPRPADAGREEVWAPPAIQQSLF